ncbi:Phosphate ABC transporter ATP-binding protein [Pseudomonas amygdali pv. mori]|uniref:Phosphate ABC transporter ATP-binding protein n=1 Tax=Pseudomonas amygdali pv. mori TaxID=34065 RepID=A0A0P9WCD1_PSEA0|nr:Phosphate ABC transporter ATP-binding protein [Pseudomonas amygdali pv. mori]
MLSIDPAARSLVSLRDLHLSFGSNRVLKGIDLDVERGQAVSIIGPSGSGKSTILRCITGLLQAQGGSIRVGQTQVDELTREAERIELRKRVGFVFQQYNLFPHLSVLENLVIAPRKVLGIERGEAEKQARALLAKVRMEHKADAYPGQLSGGQQQRVAIARALINQPGLVMLDEPTGNLDHHTAQGIQDLMRELSTSSRTAFLIVTHDMSLARQMDRVLRLEDGRLVEA